MSTRGNGDNLFTRRLSRRKAITAGAASVVTVAVTGGPEFRRETAAAGASGTNGITNIDPARLLPAQDPHAIAGRWSLQQATALLQQTGPARLRILPIDRAKFLRGQRFDLRVEAENVDPTSARIEVTVDNGGADQILRGDPTRSSANERSLEATWKNVSFSNPGTYTITATLTAGGEPVTRRVRFQVVAAQAPTRPARNVILFIGDGMGQAPITAARIVSKGITEGKYNGLLEIDTMDVYGHVTTSGMDSIATDSANSASAYATGHKSAVNAMGVYPDNTPDPNDDPRVENIVELVKRGRGMAVGLVTTADVTDATPAAFFAHTRRRSELAYIASEAFVPERQVDVYMGGGIQNFQPQSVQGSGRRDERNLMDEAKALGYSVVTTRAEMKAAGAPARLLGLFRTSHMNVYLDREVLKDPGTLRTFTDQPTLWEMTETALKSLEQNPNGFFLMVEGASIDKQEHPLDWQRAVWDMIEMDKTLGMVKRWAAARGDDTLIVVTADHNHSMSVVGTHDRSKAGRAGNGVYDAAGFPNFVDSDGDGFPDDPNPGRTLFVGFSNHPDYRDDFELETPGPREPALLDSATRAAVPNPERDPNAELQTGNLDPTQTNCVHTVDDVIIVASGPGANRFRGLLDNTEVFFAMADALGLDVPVAAAERELTAAR